MGEWHNGEVTTSSSHRKRDQRHNGEVATSLPRRKMGNDTTGRWPPPRRVGKWVTQWGGHHLLIASKFSANDTTSKLCPPRCFVGWHSEGDIPQNRSVVWKIMINTYIYLLIGRGTYLVGCVSEAHSHSPNSQRKIKAPNTRSRDSGGSWWPFWWAVTTILYSIARSKPSKTSIHARFRRCLTVGCGDDGSRCPGPWWSYDKFKLRIGISISPPTWVASHVIRSRL